jgi:ribosomal protein S18 acetylase RimI-like enzyme
MNIKKIDRSDRRKIDDFIVSHWYTMQMVVSGESIDLGSADGFYSCNGEEITGLITYCQLDGSIEILSLDSIYENRGIGTSLLNEVISLARDKGAAKIKLITTNDNLYALRFYQKRGFDMVCLHRNALDRAREIKPEIPLTGMDGIPLRHEIELELVL